MKKSTPFVLGFAIFYPFVLTLLYFVVLANSSPGVQKSVFGIGKAIQFLLPVVWVALVLREPWFIRSFRVRGVFEGIAFGTIVFLIILALYHFVLKQPGGYLAQDSQAARMILEKTGAFGIESTPLFLLFGAFYSLIHSGLEEYYWRGFVFRRLKSLMSTTAAVVVSSLGFAFHHLLLLGTYFGYANPFTWLCTLGVAVGGAYWAWNYHRFDSIWPAWISHGIIDAAIFTVGFFVLMTQTVND
ncbi:MAG: CPBP family intramembrane metalloprotease [Planctomycetaceae bacterium]|nr:CPBP family intramembrane metalloprotease [Planctomycetaceae bacterium]